MYAPEFDKSNSADRPLSYGYEAESHNFRPPNEKRVGWGTLTFVCEIFAQVGHPPVTAQRCG